MGNEAVHEEILRLLPWFVNESLGDRERRRVLAHLEGCEPCRSERDQLQRLRQAVAENIDGGVPDYRFAYRKLMARIEAAEENRRSTAAHDGNRRTSGYLPWLAAASLVLAVGLTAVLNAPRPMPAGTFETLSNPVSRAGIAHLIEVRFEQPLRAETLRAALIETQSNIVDGPDESGVYLLEVRVPEEMTDGDFIGGIRAINGVEYAAFIADRTAR